jgi:hypothetical protein
MLTRLGRKARRFNAIRRYKFLVGLYRRFHQQPTRDFVFSSPKNDFHASYAHLGLSSLSSDLLASISAILEETQR